MSVRAIPAIGMQYPGESRMVLEADHVNKDTVIALVDFHEGKYTLPETVTVLMHQLLTANNLADDSFFD